MPVFGSEVLRDVGEAFLISLLDLHAINPLSRLVKAPEEDVQDVLKKLRQDLQNEYCKVKSAKKKGKGSKTKRAWNTEGPSFELVLDDTDE